MTRLIRDNWRWAAGAVLGGIVVGAGLSTTIYLFTHTVDNPPIEVIAFHVEPTAVTPGSTITLTTHIRTLRADCYRTVMRQIQMSDGVVVTFDASDQLGHIQSIELADGTSRIIAQTVLPLVLAYGPALIRNLAVRLCSDGNSYLTLTPWVDINIVER